MRTFSSALLVGAAALSLVAVPAFAQTHVMTVSLPDGGTAQIEYTGNIPPRVVIGNAPAPLPVFAAMPTIFGGESPFAMMQRISAEMDRQAAAMFRQVDAMTARAQSGQPIEVGFGNVPPGTSGYSFVSTISSNGVCSRSVEITSTGNGDAPRVVSHRSGNCGPGAPGSTSARLPAATLPPAVAPKPVNHPDMLWTSADGPQAYTGMVRKVANSQR